MGAEIVTSFEGVAGGSRGAWTWGVGAAGGHGLVASSCGGRPTLSCAYYGCSCVCARVCVCVCV